MLKKPATTEIPIHELIAHRWSPRAFDPERMVPREQLLALLEAARWAPSCRGEEPWRFLIFDKQTQPQAWEKALNCLEDSNQKWAQRAPVLILATIVNIFEHNDSPNRWAAYDCGAACENLCLQAVHLGLVTHQMGGFKLAKTHELLGLPVEVTCMSMIALGYQADPQILEGDYLTRELAQRNRKPLGERFFEAEWERPFKI